MKDEKKGSRGNTMVEVIVSFGILVLMVAIFSDVFMTGSRTAVRTADLIEEKEALYEAYRLGEGLREEKVGGGTVRFERIDGDGWQEDGFTLEGMEVYEHTSMEGKAGAVYDVMSDRGR